MSEDVCLVIEVLTGRSADWVWSWISSKALDFIAFWGRYHCYLEWRTARGSSCQLEEIKGVYQKKKWWSYAVTAETPFFSPLWTCLHVCKITIDLMHVLLDKIILKIVCESLALTAFEFSTRIFLNMQIAALFCICRSFSRYHVRAISYSAPT